MTTTQAAVLTRWFPADVLLPGRAHPWHRVYVMVTETDVMVWSEPKETPDWSAPVDWSQTVLPESDQPVRYGLDLHTTEGLVVVTLGSGCRCGVLGKWAGPSWARLERARS